jgi:hypothetical protein
MGVLYLFLSSMSFDSNGDGGSDDGYGMYSFAVISDNLVKTQLHSDNISILPPSFDGNGNCDGDGDGDNGDGTLGCWIISGNLVKMKPHPNITLSLL